MDVDCNETTIFLFCSTKSLAPLLCCFALLFLCFMLTSGKLSRKLVFLKRIIFSDLLVAREHCPTTCVVQGERKYGEKTRRRNVLDKYAPPIDF